MGIYGQNAFSGIRGKRDYILEILSSSIITKILLTSCENFLSYLGFLNEKVRLEYLEVSFNSKLLVILRHTNSKVKLMLEIPTSKGLICQATLCI